MFLAAAETNAYDDDPKAVPLLDEATVAAIRAQVQAQYPGWNPDRMTMDYQPGDELFSRLLRSAAVDSFYRGRSESERQSAAGGGAGLLIAAAAAYFLLG
jgi:hypothetical protein